MEALQVRRLGYALGAEVRGIDLRQTPSDDMIAELRKLWLDHLLLCFPDQKLSNAEFTAFAGRFGPYEDTTTSKHIDPNFSMMTLITTSPVAGKPWDGFKEGRAWHSDLSFRTAPTTAQFLLAKEIPNVGGDTMFANQYMAYETLSPTLQGVLSELSCVHDYLLTGDILKKKPEELEAILKIHVAPAVHPVIYVHPETERKALFVRGSRTRRFLGMTDGESAPLITYLNEHAVRYEFTYRHRWRTNDLVMWDNRCTMHIALLDYDPQRDFRLLWRVALTGPPSGKAYELDYASLYPQTALATAR